MGNVKFDFSGQVAVVTGAASGLGRGIAYEFARAGAKVVLADMNTEGGEAAVKKICEDGGEAVFVKTNVADEVSSANLIQTAIETFGRLDILVNGAGVCNRNFGNPFTDLPDSDFAFTHDVNVMGEVHTIRAAYDYLKKQGRGRIINIASTVGHSTNLLNVPYCISKAAALNLTVNLAKELGPFGITVNAICPGYIYTSIYENARDGMVAKNPAFEGKTGKEIVEYLAKMNCATQKEQTVEDVAWSTLFLASEEAAALNGIYIDVAGGYKI